MYNNLINNPPPKLVNKDDEIVWTILRKVEIKENLLW